MHGKMVPHYIWTAHLLKLGKPLVSAEKCRVSPMCSVLHFTKLEGGCWDCVDSQKNILIFLELQQVEQMVFSPTPHRSLSFPSSCPIVHFSHLSVGLVQIQHPLKSMENLPLTLFGFASCCLWSLLPSAIPEPKSLLWPLHSWDPVHASSFSSFPVLCQEHQQSSDG